MSVPPSLRFLLVALLICLLPSIGHAGDAAPPAADEPATTAPAEETPAVEDVEKTAEEAADDEKKKSVLMELFEQGGPTMYFISLLLLVTLAITVERAINVRRGNFVPYGLADEAANLYLQGKHKAAENLGRENGSILGDVIAFCAQHHREDLSTIDEGAGDVAGRAINKHQQMAYWLAVVATLAPLLGLLGTVLGMIKSFRAVALTGDIGDIGQVAGGISEALVTTAYGLIVAVPSLAAFHFFKIRINTMAVAVEDACSDFIVSNCGKTAAAGGEA